MDSCFLTSPLLRFAEMSRPFGNGFKPTVVHTRRVKQRAPLFASACGAAV